MAPPPLCPHESTLMKLVKGRTLEALLNPRWGSIPQRSGRWRPS
jgi:hypothetical protein